ncbi:hypothetical protein [Ktedonobacter racemifer]|uniref:Uncharacterized protein n=1 Tax=Ktedonobacter racemifer DSM 44963 TaxID=485913 RepID=D6TYT7_KTERA|nr:hypothetical protein [Ktedonobacter racemifer]EFH85162.1 hypothetical protein Krac_6330 [Ktedonobacter racemifer DSM 44963]
MPQFQSDIPYPLCQELGKLLAPRRVRVPAICVLLFIFIGQHRLKRATMQIQVKGVRSRKRRGGKGTHKEFGTVLKKR